MEFSLLMFCSYLNGCRLCSSVTVENASSVSAVDWTNCNDTRPYNMTVTNSAFEELYWESKSCCLGSLTIKYRTGGIDILIPYIHDRWVKSCKASICHQVKFCFIHATTSELFSFRLSFTITFWLIICLILIYFQGPEIKSEPNYQSGNVNVV